MIDFYPLLRPLIFALPPETAHSLTLAALKTGALRLAPRLSAAEKQALTVEIAGLRFPNPLGMAAGFDKNAEAPLALLRLGFGFAEIGTVTPRPQAGNSPPRLFRLVADKAIINRMGFNNAGHDAVHQNLARLQQAKRKHADIIGVNIGANKDSEDKISDYVLGLRKFYDAADYFTVNISSPNTPGLRDLQGRENLRRLLAALRAAQAEAQAQFGAARPVFLKIAPDLSEAEMDDIAAEFLAAPLSGLIISNTTVSRSHLRAEDKAAEAGGLSGQPLFALSTIVLAKMRQRLGEAVPLIGAGGVEDAQTALAKIKAGADLVQLYSGLVYQGAWAVPRLVEGLAKACRKEGAAHISALRGLETKQWAARGLEI